MSTDNDPKLRILIIGSTEADAWNFLGLDPNPNQKSGTPAREDRESKKVPDSVWPPDAKAIGHFWGLDVADDPSMPDPGAQQYDLVIFTRAATLNVDAECPWLQEHRYRGGQVYWRLE